MKFNKKIKIVRLNIKRVRVFVKYWIFWNECLSNSIKGGKKVYWR